MKNTFSRRIIVLHTSRTVYAFLGVAHLIVAHVACCWLFGLEFRLLGFLRLPWELTPVPPGDRPVAWVFFLYFALFGLVCTWRALLPMTVFRADHRGVRVNTGKLFPRMHAAPWSAVKNFSEGTIREIIQKGTIRRQLVELPAVKVWFDDSIDLGRKGPRYLKPDSRHSCLILEGCFRQAGLKVPEAVAVLKEMRDHFLKSDS